MTGTPSRRALITGALRERFPDGVVPRGVLYEMDNEFGVDPKYTRRIARELGFTLPGREGRVGTCRLCGRSSMPDSVYCYDCQHVQLTCARCGREFRRRRANVAGFSPTRMSTTGRLFCGPQCRADSLIRGAQSKLAQRRVAAGLRQEDIAQALGVSRQLVGRWERGTRSISSVWRERPEELLGDRPKHESL